MQYPTVDVMGTQINTGDWTWYERAVLEKASSGSSGYVCHCNVHSVVTACHDVALRAALDRAYLRAPDGAPVAWVASQRTGRRQPRISGPDLMLRLCEAASANNISVFLYGSTPTTLDALSQRLADAYPQLHIAGTYSPPFRPLTGTEEEEIIAKIQRSGAGIVFVGLGCPKQEIWMSTVSDRLPSVLIGVGAAFDFHAGLVSRAPTVVRKMGLEWLHRLLQEPARLWRRYLYTNSAFAWYVLKNAVLGKLGRA